MATVVVVTAGEVVLVVGFNLGRVDGVVVEGTVVVPELPLDTGTVVVIAVVVVAGTVVVVPPDLALVTGF